MRRWNHFFDQLQSHIEKFGLRRCVALLLAIVLTITSIKFDWWSIGSQADPNQPTYDAPDTETSQADFDTAGTDTEDASDTSAATDYNNASNAVAASSTAVAQSAQDSSDISTADDDYDYGDDSDYDDIDDSDAFDAADSDDDDDYDTSDNDDDDDYDSDDDDEEDSDDYHYYYDDDVDSDANDMPSGRFVETTPEEGIHVTAQYSSDTFPSGTTMKLENVTDDYVLDIINGRVPGITDIAAVKITFEDSEGDEVEPDKKLRVAINLDNPMNTDRLMLVHINSDEEAYQVADDRIERLTEGNATFYADSFSVYAILELSGDNAITSTARSNVSSSYDDEDDDADDEDEDEVEYGDYSIVDPDEDNSATDNEQTLILHRPMIILNPLMIMQARKQ